MQIMQIDHEETPSNMIAQKVSLTDTTYKYTHIHTSRLCQLNSLKTHINITLHKRKHADAHILTHTHTQHLHIH